MNKPQKIWTYAVKSYDYERACQYYERNYDLIVGQNTNFDDETYLGNSTDKVCRFCGRKEPEVTFLKKAHVFPIATGNIKLLSYYECDDCNIFFGRYLEGDYQNLFSFVHNLYMVGGRKGKIPTVQSNDNCNKISVINRSCGEKIHLISGIAGKEHVEIKENTVTLSSPNITIIPIAIYKCLTKMALAIMPEAELLNFQKTLSWIREKEHKPIMEKKHMCRYIEIKNAPYVKYPMGYLFKRKSNSKDGPYMIFLYVYAKMAIMIEVPSDKVKYSYDIRKIYPLIFGMPIEDIIIDLSCTEKCFIEGEKRELLYGYSEDLSEEIGNPNTENEYVQLIRKNMSDLK